MQGNTPADKGNQKPSLSWSQPQGQKPAQPQAPAQQNLSIKSIAPAQKQPGKTNAGLYAGIFIGGLIIGVLVGWGITSSRGPAATTGGDMASAGTPSSFEGTMTAPSSAQMTGSSTGLTIPSPQAAGLTVSVSKVAVTAPTWVVIYEDHNGVAGNALGATLFYPASQGGQSSGTVELLRGTSPGETYLAGESLDDGDHKFSLTLDKPVRDAQGNPLWVEFKTQ